jgi:hypothetical protein
VTDLSQDSWSNERAVYERLKQYGVVDDLDRIPVEAFVLAAGAIANFKRCPVTARDMDQMKALGKQEINRRAAFNKAAALLQAEIDCPGTAGHLHVQQWSAAIAVLKMPRGGITELPGSWIRATKKGDSIRAWTYMATEILGWILWSLKSYEVDHSRKMTGLARFARDALGFIGINDLPSEREILKALDKNLIDTDTE